MSSLYYTSYCRICCSSIKTRSSTSHVILLPAAAMATSRRQQPATKRKRALVPVVLHDALSDICPYWPASPAFEPQRVLLGRLFLINSYRTKYVSVGFYPARDYQPLVESQRHTEGRVEIHHSQRGAYRHAGGLSAQDARFRLQWKRDRCRVREW